MSDPKTKPFDLMDKDIEELRELAEWFEIRGDKLNGHFLRDVAHRYEIAAACVRLRGNE